MKDQIRSYLERFEADAGVSVVIASETGSRLTASHRPDSDYDVKAVFVRPIRQYAALAAPSDVVRPPVEGLLDFYLHDIRWMLVQIVKGQPAALDMIYSPVVYQHDEGVVDALTGLHKRCFDIDETAHLFRSVAVSSLHGSMKRRDKAQAKEIAYAVRALGRSAWLRSTGSYPVPGKDLALSESMAQTLSWLDAVREDAVASLDRTRLATVVGQIEAMIAEHPGSSFRNRDAMLEDAGKVLFRIFDAVCGDPEPSGPAF